MKEMTNRLPEQESGTSQEAVVSHISSGIKEVSSEMARYSVTPTPDALLSAEDIKNATDDEVARILSQKVSIDDPNLEIGDKTKQQVFDTASLATAKAEVLEEEIKDTGVRQRLKEFRESVWKGAGQTIVKTGTASSVLALALTSCSAVEELPSTGGQEAPTEPVATEAASALPTKEPTKVPTEAPTETQESTPTEIPLPESFADKEAQQSVIDEFLELSGYSSLEEAGKVLEGIELYQKYNMVRVYSLYEGAPMTLRTIDFIVGSYEVSIEGKNSFGIDKTFILLTYNPELQRTIPYLLGGEKTDGSWFHGTAAMLELNRENHEEDIGPYSLSNLQEAREWVEDRKGDVVSQNWLYRYPDTDDIQDDTTYLWDGTLKSIVSDSQGYIVGYTTDRSELTEIPADQGFADRAHFILDNLDTEKDLGVISYHVNSYMNYSVLQE